MKWMTYWEETMTEDVSTRRKILEQVKNGEISPEEGFKLIHRARENSLPCQQPSNPVYEADSYVPVEPGPGDDETVVAVVGMSCRFPGANNPGEFWNNLASGKNSVTKVPAGRWKVKANHDGHNDKGTQWGAFLDDIDAFDPLFFNLAPQEAAFMDPQQRLFLQEAWKAIEDAGYSPRDLQGKPYGVFAGCAAGDYSIRVREETGTLTADFFTGNAGSLLPARIAYYLNLKGPVMAVDTACSSSLAAIHLAWESIRSGACEGAIVGGVMISTTPTFHTLAGLAGMLSPHGQCKSFDDTADGFVPGEGVGVVMLKTLKRAREQGDRIYAVIKGSGINHNGKTVGITAPCSPAQTALESEVYRRFHIHPQTIGYVEAHGTGTKLGDPIEIQALTDTFRKYTREKQFCAVGSVKTNIGHTLTAAGAASLIKVLLAFKHRQIPPSLHFNTPNRHIDFENSPFYVNTRLQAWKARSENTPRRAAVSSFGFSGTNVHMVLEEPPGEIRNLTSTRPYFFIPISAKTSEALQKKYKDLLHWLDENPGEFGGDIAFTLQAGRAHFSLRSAFVVKDTQDLKQKLDSLGKTGQTRDYRLKDLNSREAPGSQPGADTDASPLTRHQEGLIAEIRDSQSLPGPAYKDKLMTLADLYVNGHDPDLTDFYREEGYRRISLPTYPFARQRYWLPADTGRVNRQTAPGRGLENFQQDLVKIASRILKIDEACMTADGDLHEYGFDSVTLTAFADKISELYGIELIPTVFFQLESPTLRSLAGYLSGNYPGQLRQYYRENLPGPGGPDQDTHPEKEEISTGLAHITHTSYTSHTSHQSHQSHEPIAIIGMSGILPQSENLEKFWHHLEAGDDLISEAPPHRWDWRSFGDFAGPRWGGFIKEVDRFDADFFNISPREARLMDPQQRLFLEIVWKTIEDAGYSASALSGTNTGLFVGVSAFEYGDILSAAGVPMDGHVATGLSHSLLANRISYVLNLHGPSESVDTACSSSLVAVNRAIASIMDGTCEMAIAGGVNLMLSPRSFLAFASAGMLAGDGRCKTFDERADGYVRGEGSGAVFLKPLHQAAADNDHIYAVIKSTALNHGGRSHSLTAPNANAQAALLVQAYEKANLDPSTITYIETHGTGTRLGDPVEIDGLKKAFTQLYRQWGKPLPGKPTCGLGTVKTNIGHLEAAAGIASILKVLLAVKYRKIPGNVHFKKLNPYLQLENTPFYIVGSTIPWKPGKDDENREIPLRAGISSFGFGGSNAHIVLEEYRAQQFPLIHREDKPQIIVLSAKNSKSLDICVQQMLHFLEMMDPKTPVAPPPHRALSYDIRAELTRTAAGILSVSASEIDPVESLVDYGFDPQRLTRLAAPLEELYGLKITAADFGGNTSIDSLAHSLAGNEPGPVNPVSPEKRFNAAPSLTDIAYTLQLGREPMEERLAVVVSDTRTLWEKLQRYRQGDKEIPAFYRGSTKNRTSSLPQPANPPQANQEETVKTVKQALENRDFQKIAQLFVQGVDIYWQLLYPAQKPKRVSLPTYPFQRTRYWVDSLPGSPGEPGPGPIQEQKKITPSNSLKLKDPGLKRKENIASPAKIKLVVKTMNNGNPSTVEAMRVTAANKKLRLVDKKTASPSTGKNSGAVNIDKPVHDPVSYIPASSRPVPAAAETILARVKELLAQVLFLEVEKVDENKPFMELGLDSILAVEFTRKLEADFRVEIRATKLYDYSTVDKLAGYITSLTGTAAVTPGPPGPSTPLGNGSGLVNPVKNLLARVLFLEAEKVDENKPFMELGLDSILAVEFTRKLEAEFGVEVRATKLYDYSTVCSLAGYLSTLVKPGEKQPPVPGPAAASMGAAPGHKPGTGTSAADKQLEYFLEKYELESPSGPGPTAAGSGSVEVVEQAAPAAKANKPGPGRMNIAIIGMSARFPGADHISQYWDNLARGVDSVTEVPPGRWDAARYYDPNPQAPGKALCKWGGFLRDIDRFDPLFFNISPAEAEQMDPHQRLFLQEAWRALENAGYSAQALNQMNCGVYAGVMSASEYPAFSMYNDHAILAARLPYFLNLKGPALAIDTACSSSLVAMHLACRSLLAGETDMMLAGGVALYLTEKPFIGMSQMGGILSRQGKCKTFDNSADGFVPGEGAAVLVLKLLEKAIADHDHIYGVIIGSGLNQDGRTNGITAPSSESQLKLETEVYKNSGIDPGTISYVEAHGTGTKLGDPIEIEALTAAFRQYTDKKQFCPIGSVKTNIGHTSAAAGAAGVIKVLLSMKHQKIPPSLHYHQENEHIDFKNSPFYVNTELSDWKKPANHPRRAAVSSFGYSGTNAHMILEEPPMPPPHPADTRPFHLICLSARGEKVLNNKLKDLVHWLDRDGAGCRLADIAYTRALRRIHFTSRAAIIAGDTLQLKTFITRLLQGEKSDNYRTGTVSPKDHSSGAQFTITANQLLDQVGQPQHLSPAEYKSKLSALADLYVQGCDPDWTVIYPGNLQHSIPMPTYPFARERYWIDKSQTDLQAPAASPGTAAAGTGPGPIPTRLQREHLSTRWTGTEIKQQIQKDLGKFIETVLKVKEEDISLEKPMFQYGFDSITFIDYINLVKQTYNIDFAVESFFDLGTPTVDSFGELLYRQFKERFTEYFCALDQGPLSGGEETREVAPGEKAGTGEATAIIGLGCTMPQADDPADFWEYLAQGKSLLIDFPHQRWADEMLPPAGQTRARGGFLTGADVFDAPFFNVSASEAEIMDPQQRIFLQTVWKAIEDAGYKCSDLEGTSTGVFVGAGESGYRDVDNPPVLAANRVSYFFNFRGPSEIIDSAGTSSLAALCRGVQAIRSGTCRIAIVGGINIIASPKKLQSRDPLTASTPGHEPGEGAAALVLKSLASAAADGDHIYAIIKGIHQNHGGRSGSFSFSDTASMAELLTQTYENAGIDPGTIGYIELHHLGIDPVSQAELEALETSFIGLYKKRGQPLPQKPHCGIGSIRPTTGYLESAAGIASLMKVLLALKYRKLPALPGEPAARLQEKLKPTPFYIVQATQPWEPLTDSQHQPLPLRAGISTFAYGGTNAHVILEEGPHGQGAAPRASNEKPAAPGAGNEQGPHLIILSAKNKGRLKDYAAKLKDFLETPGIQDIQRPGPQEPTDKKNLRREIEDEILLISNDTLKITPGGYEPASINAFIRGINETFNLEIAADIFNNHSSLAAFIKYLAKNYHQQFLDYYNRNRVPNSYPPMDHNLADIAYTLQVGREEMDERLAVVVTGKEELLEKLKLYNEGQPQVENLYTGNVNQYKQQVTMLLGGEEKQEFIRSLVKKRSFSRLAYSWVLGVEIGWGILYEDAKPHPRRVSLPTYPFEKKRYWLPPYPTSTKNSKIAPIKEKPGKPIKPIKPIKQEQPEKKEKQEKKEVIDG
jgi:acyl transferase domain-containing protein/acyl carrier protein